MKCYYQWWYPLKNNSQGQLHFSILDVAMIKKLSFTLLSLLFPSARFHSIPGNQHVPFSSCPWVELQTFLSMSSKRSLFKSSFKLLSSAHWVILIPSFSRPFQFLKRTVAVGCLWLSCKLENLQFEADWSTADNSFLCKINITQSILHGVRILQ